MPFTFVGGTKHDRDRLRTLTAYVFKSAGIEQEETIDCRAASKCSADDPLSSTKQQQQKKDASASSTEKTRNESPLLLISTSDEAQSSDNNDNNANKRKRTSLLSRHEIEAGDEEACSVPSKKSRSEEETDLKEIGSRVLAAIASYDAHEKKERNLQPFATITRAPHYRLFVNAYGSNNETLLCDLGQIIQNCEPLRRAYTIDMSTTRADAEKALAASGNGGGDQQRLFAKQRLIDSDLPFIAVSTEMLKKYDLWQLLESLAQTAKSKSAQTVQSMDLLLTGRLPRGAETAAHGAVDTVLLSSVRGTAAVNVVQWIDALYEFDNFLHARAAETWLINCEFLHQHYCLPRLCVPQDSEQKIADAKQLNEARYAANLLPFFLLVKLYRDMIVSQTDYRDAVRFLDCFTQRFEPYYASELQLLRNMCLPWHFTEHIERDTTIGRLIGGRVQLEVTDTARAVLHYINTLAVPQMRDAFLKHFVLLTCGDGGGGGRGARNSNNNNRNNNSAQRSRAAVVDGHMQLVPSLSAAII